MTISREEIFGPVLSIIPYRTEQEAIEKANDSVYGLAAYVSSLNLEHARKVAAELRAGTVNINYPDWDTHAPFGATSSPATARNTPIGESTNSSRPRGSWVTAPLEPEVPMDVASAACGRRLFRIVGRCKSGIRDAATLPRNAAPAFND